MSYHISTIISTLVQFKWEVGSCDSILPLPIKYASNLSVF